MKKYNVGVIGYGWVSGAHIAAISATAQGRVTAIYSSRPQDDAALSAKHGGATRLAVDKHRWSRLSMKMLDSGDVSDHPYQLQFQTFFDAIDRDEEMPLTSLGEALASHRVVLAADLSAREGRTVRLAGLL